MRISDWSSDVCSSDLHLGHHGSGGRSHRIPSFVERERGERGIGSRRGRGPHGVSSVRKLTHDPTHHRVSGPADDLDVSADLQFLTYSFDRVQSCLRSEEHTSELQSLMRISYAVFCLKKKKQ